MNVAFAALVALTVYGAFRLAQDYVRRSMRSFESADIALTKAMNLATDLLEKDISLSLARIVIGLVGAAGCGCFVRGFVFGHYLPRFSKGRPRDPIWDQAFADLDEASAEVRKLFWQLNAFIVLYDSYRNPLQGWFFRRALSQIIQPEPTYEARVEAQLATFSVLSRRGKAILHPA